MSKSLKEYKDFIDGLVYVNNGYGHGNVSARRVRRGIWHDEPPPDQRMYNQLLASLTKEQRELVAQLLEHEYHSAIHDVLAFLTDKGYRLTKDGVELEYEPFDTENYFDFVARVEGQAWPDDEGSDNL